MKTKPFFTNHFGLHALYNGANRVYAHELAGRLHERREDSSGPHTVELPRAARLTSHLAGEFKSPRDSIEAKLVALGIISRQGKENKKRRLTDYEAAQILAKPLSPVESVQ